MKDSVDAERYHRQLILPALGVAGQQRVAAARVVVVGCGGLGAPVLHYLAAAGVGALTLVDDDVVELSNLNRQVLFGPADVGARKARRAGDWVQTFAPECDVTVHEKRLTPANAAEILGDHDVVVDATDGLPSKYLLNDAAVVTKRPLVHGAVTALVGQVMVVPAGGAPCLRCLFPTLPGPEDVPTCQTAGIIGAAAGVIGSIMALEVLKLIGLGGASLSGAFLSYDAGQHRTHRVDVPADAACPACGRHATITGDDERDYVAEPAA